MDLTLLRESHTFILIIVIISLCATTGLSADAHVYMTNNLGPDTFIAVHCANNGKEMGQQDIPNNSEIEWKFRIAYNGLKTGLVIGPEKLSDLGVEPVIEQQSNQIETEPKPLIVILGKLECNANLPGAKQLDFLAFDLTTGSCRPDDCRWKFTPQGVFQLINGNWVFRFTWPH